MLQKIRVVAKVVYANVEEKTSKAGNDYTEVKVGMRTPEGVMVFNKFIKKETESQWLSEKQEEMDKIVETFESGKDVYVSWNTKPMEDKKTKELFNFNLMSVSKNDEGNYSFNTNGTLTFIEHTDEGDETITLHMPQFGGGTKDFKFESMKTLVDIQAVVEMTNEQETIFTDCKEDYPNEVYAVLSDAIYEKCDCINNFEDGKAYRFKAELVKGAYVESGGDEEEFSFDEEISTSNGYYESDKLVITKPLGVAPDIKVEDTDSTDPF